MNILMIGNGFDIAHGLQTKYPEFLKWIIHEYNFFGYLKEQNLEIEIIKNMEICLEIPEEINEEVEMSRMDYDIQRELWNMIDENVWFQLFFRNQKYIKDNWIDFESEISRVIKLIDSDMIRIKAEENEIVREISESYLSEYFLEDLDIRQEDSYTNFLESLGRKVPIGEESKLFQEYLEKNPIVPQKEEITYGQLIQRLEYDLNRLIRALEIYLCEYVETKDVIQLELIKNLHPDHVLSFNYTDTYEKHYGNGKKIEYDYIHGKANIKNSVDTSNMVLGIDEYLPDDRVNKDVEFIAFKKFYQRIHKETGCKYRDWVDEIRDRYQLYKEDKQKQEQFENMNIPNLTQMKSGMKYRITRPVEYERHNLYIFGHSLDVTDKDILRDLILNDNVFTTIYYCNKKVYGQQIANLVKVIGKDELIRRTGGKTKTIEFVDQQEYVKMV